MKDYLEKRREELRKQGGFTLMEMLIVVAIIAVLVAIAIPVFTSQLERSREATDKANVRSGYAELVTAYLTDGGTPSVSIPAQQTVANWQSEDNEPDKIKIGTNLTATTSGGKKTSGGELEVTAVTKGNSYVLSINSNGDVKQIN